ncbi:hypothetical protein RQN30_06785 [Arcanobacterium hippocoleae]
MAGVAGLLGAVGVRAGCNYYRRKCLRLCWSQDRDNDGTPVVT